MRIAINGFGRIGKNFFRALMYDKKALKKIEVVAINLGPGSTEHVAHLFKYDTIMGTFEGTVEQQRKTLIVNGKKYPLLTESDATKLPWKQLKVDWVVDCSGKFTKRAKAEEHLKAGAKTVLISAPATDEDVAIIPGVNDAAFDKAKHKIVSLGSCTTNALMPMLKVLHESCGFKQGHMYTAHAYTNSQPILDVEGKDPRRARAAALNIVPTSTGASKMVKKIMPELEGKLEAAAIRVPVGIVSLVTISFVSSKKLTARTINNAFERASKKGSLVGILGISNALCVSSDYAGICESVIVDAPLTTVWGTMASVSGWYDNEWAYGLRLKDFLLNQA